MVNSIGSYGVASFDLVLRQPEAQTPTTQAASANTQPVDTFTRGAVASLSGNAGAGGYEQQVVRQNIQSANPDLQTLTDVLKSIDILA